MSTRRGLAIFVAIARVRQRVETVAGGYNCLMRRSGTLAALARWSTAALIGLAASQPLAQGALPRGADILLHYHRIAALTEMWARGEFYSVWFPFLAAGYGYPLLLYYAPLAHYMGAAWVALGAGYTAATLLTFALALMIASTGAFALARRWVGTGPALVASAAFALSPYILVDAFDRSALSELLALALAPWVFALVSAYVETGRARHGLAGALAFAALTLSHNITALTFAPLVGLWAALGGALAARRGAPAEFVRPILRAVGQLALGLGLSAFFWAPALLERDASRIDQALLSAYDFRTAFVSADSLLAFPAPFDDRLVNGAVAYGVGLPQLVLAGIAAIAVVRRMRAPGQRRAAVWTAFCLVCAGLGMLMTLRASLPLWEAVPLLRYVLYPSRFFGLASLFLALLSGDGAQALADWLSSRAGRVARAALPVALAGAIVVYGFGWQFARRHPADVPTGGANISAAERTLGIVGTTSIGEYLPREATLLPEADAPTVGLGGGALLRSQLPAGVRVLDEDIRPLRYRAVVDAEGPVTLAFGQFAFPGWRVRVNGREAMVAPTSPHGLISFAAPAGRSQIDIAFGATPARSAALAASLVSAVLALVWALAAARRRRADDAPAPPRAPAWTGRIALTVVALVVVKGAVLDTTNNPLRVTRLQAPYVRGALPVNANFGGALELMGADPPVASASRDEVSVDLFWRRLRSSDTTDYSVFTRLVDANGQTISALDTVHPSGDYPTSRLPVDDYARDRRRMPLTADVPPGEYAMLAGVYPRGRPDQRVPLLDAAGAPIQGGPEARLTRVMTVTLGRPGAAAPPGSAGPKHLRRAALSPALVVEGADADFTALRAGSTFVTPIWFSALAAPARDETVCFSLEAGGERTELACAPPVPGYPTGEWRAGDLWRATHALRVPPELPTNVYTLGVRIGDAAPAPLFAIAIDAPPMRMAPPDIALQPSGVALGGFGRLEGYVAPVSAQPGGQLRVTLVWRCIGETPADATVFVQLVDSRGERKQGRDGAPVDGGVERPTYTWRVGEVVVDVKDMDIPADLAPGNYGLVVGMYDAGTHRRLTLADGGDAIRLPEVVGVAP